MTARNIKTEATSPVEDSVLEEEAEAEKVDELEVILPTAADLTIGGIPAKIGHLKARELFTLIRVFTNGLGGAFSQFNLNPRSKDELQGTVIAMFMLAVPNALDDFADFIQIVVSPKNPSQDAELRAALQNPEFEEILDVMTVLIEQEKGNFLSIVGKVRAISTKIGASQIQQK